MGWTARNLTDTFHLPPGIFAPSAYDFPDDRTRHVIYLGGTGVSDSTGVLHELYCGTDDVWHEKDLLAESGGPHASSAPRAYLFVLEGTQHVLYLGTAGDGRLRELYQDDGWHANDLTADSGSQPARKVAQGFEYASGRAQVVVFQGIDRHVHVLTRKSRDDGDPSWVHKDLTSDHGGPVCARAPGGYSFSPGGTMHVDYLGDDGRLYEYTGTANLTWGEPVDIGAGLDGPGGFADDAYRGYGFAADGTRQVDVVDTAGDVWEYRYDGSWSVENLTGPLGAGPVLAGTSVSAYAFEATDAVPVPTQHVVYAGADHLIHELWRDPTGWHENPLTGAGQPPAASTPSAFVDHASSTQHVFYTSQANEVVELRWTDRPTLSETARPRHRLD
ncbi:hypothetical protein [Leifsonia sp. PS1209]|uniref:hypothetical protein n=1 Tax=Leifsonia sp. PS1209 TaxID=2724914 RepID=UPI001442C1A7|nr:hypothetical protein [Leifsonia sp. PS1209]QIZ99147.1 hypothetical protein HF024_11920 [Leifsonia sp. PS1209]